MSGIGRDPNIRRRSMGDKPALRVVSGNVVGPIWSPDMACSVHLAYSPERASGAWPKLYRIEDLVSKYYCGRTRTARDSACGLADPARGLAALRALPGGDAVAEAWDSRDAALAGYREQLSAQRHIRALGLDPAFEKQTGWLARAAALRHLALAGRP
jgi:hypothetical protein